MCFDILGAGLVVFMKRFLQTLTLLLSTVLISAAFGWHDETHLAVAKAAGYYKWYNAVGADIAKTKAGNIEMYNHFFDNKEKAEVTPEMVFNQVERYNNPNDPSGHLYGAIIASLREYKRHAESGKYAEYHIALCAHYLADLSQPLHNTHYDNFNKTHHGINDGIVEEEVLENIGEIKKNMHPVTLRTEHFENDLAREIARIANQARKLGYILKKENRDMTKEEAYIQLGYSASLLKAVLIHLGKKTDIH